MLQKDYCLCLLFVSQTNKGSGDMNFKGNKDNCGLR
jgi:hypothetical protein